MCVRQVHLIILIYIQCVLIVILEEKLEEVNKSKQSSFTFNASFSLLNTVVCIHLLVELYFMNYYHDSD